MSYLLTDPTTVVVVGGTQGRRDAVASAVQAGAAETVVTVETVAETRQRLDDRDDVGCVVLLDADPESVTIVCEAAATVEVSGLLPVVACGPESTAREAAAHEACRYLPASTPPEEVRELVEDALAAYERRRDEAADSTFLQTLLSEGEIMIFAKDDEGRYLRMADLPSTPYPSEARGKTDREVYDGDPGTSRRAYEDDLRVAETGEPIREKVEKHGGGPGGTFWVETTKLPWSAGGEVRGVVGHVVGVTDRVRCEQELDRQFSRFERFASYVSHDLRTPLQISLGAVEQARESEGEDLASALDRIERANGRIEEILDDLSALSKGDRSGATLPAELLDVLDVGVPSTELASLVENVWRIGATGDATLDVGVPPGTVLRAETETVRPLVENLLKNAVDHGGDDVTVEVEITGRGFYVADDGPGIPEDEREKVLESGYTTSEEGTGTGLAIVRDTVEQADWGLEIGDSDLGGARFEVTDAPVVFPIEATPTERVPLGENRDVGDVSIPGEATYDELTDRWTVVADGRDIWRDIDEFHFVYGESPGPVRIEGRLVDLERAHEYSKAGLMVRDALDEDASFAFVGATAEHGTETVWRDRSGADATSEQFEESYEAYRWYRADIVDGDVTLSMSTDGDEWQPIDQRHVDLDGDLFVGLAVCSHTREETCEAQFEDVIVTRLDVD
jgi:regulation of enolase protein 1 (concanavalin A-like superfamily)